MTQTTGGPPGSRNAPRPGRLHWPILALIILLWVLLGFFASLAADSGLLPALRWPLALALVALAFWVILCRRCENRWERVGLVAMLASIISDILGSRLGFYFFAAVAIAGFIGWETLRSRASTQ